MSREVTVVDPGLGNLASVVRALESVGAAVRVTRDPDEVADARCVVLSGSGAFGEATDRLVNGPLGAALRSVIALGRPYLGISVGMQILFDSTEENGGKAGLGVLSGTCKRFPVDMADPLYASVPGAADRPHRCLKVPHMGWNQVEPSGAHYYFLHSHYCVPTNPEDVMWTTGYGRVTFASAVRRDNVLGCQFLPEKSQREGQKFLRGWVLGGAS